MSMDTFSFYEMDIRRRKTFGSASALIQYRFERDNGEVKQLKEARNYVSHWEDMRQQNLGLLFWGMPGTGKTFAAACITMRGSSTVLFIRIFRSCFWLRIF